MSLLLLSRSLFQKKNSSPRFEYNFKEEECFNHKINFKIIFLSFLFFSSIIITTIFLPLSIVGKVERNSWFPSECLVNNISQSFHTFYNHGEKNYTQVKWDVMERETLKFIIKEYQNDFDLAQNDILKKPIDFYGSCFYHIYSNELMWELKDNPWIDSEWFLGYISMTFGILSLISIIFIIIFCIKKNYL